MIREVCVVCGLARPGDRDCACCGLEAGAAPPPRTAWAMRGDWIARGAGWSQPDARPDGWDLEAQLEQIPRSSRFRWGEQAPTAPTRLTRARIVLAATVVGTAAGVGAWMATGVPIWPPIGAIAGVGVGDLVAGRRA